MNWTMNKTNRVRSLEFSLPDDLFDAARNYLRGWRGIVVLASVAIAVGVTFNWGWLVAVGIAPVLLSLLPCAVVCALGLCMSKMTGRKSCPADQQADRRPCEIAPRESESDRSNCNLKGDEHA